MSHLHFYFVFKKFHTGNAIRTPILPQSYKERPDDRHPKTEIQIYKSAALQSKTRKVFPPP